jgi:hypothetical protein
MAHVMVTVVNMVQSRLCLVPVATAVGADSKVGPSGEAAAVTGQQLSGVLRHRLRSRLSPVANHMTSAASCQTHPGLRPCASDPNQDDQARCDGVLQ